MGVGAGHLPPPVVDLARRPPQLVGREEGAPLAQVRPDGLLDGPGRATGARPDEAGGPDPLHDLADLGGDGDPEPLDPLRLDTRLLGDLGDRPAGSEAGLHVAHAQRAAPAGLHHGLGLCVVLSLGALRRSRPGLLDRGEQLVVDVHHEPARAAALARAEDQSFAIGREPNEMELLHARPASGRVAPRTSVATSRAGTVAA
jgi:hypothetical protein